MSSRVEFTEVNSRVVKPWLHHFQSCITRFGKSIIWK